MIIAVPDNRFHVRSLSMKTMYYLKITSLTEPYSTRCRKNHAKPLILISTYILSKLKELPPSLNHLRNQARTNDHSTLQKNPPLSFPFIGRIPSTYTLIPFISLPFSSISHITTIRLLDSSAPYLLSLRI